MQEAAEDESSVKGRRRSADLHHAGSAQHLHHARTAQIPMPSPSQSSEEKEDKQTAATKQQQQQQQQKHETQQLVRSALSIAVTTVIACVHSGYITVTMTATATAIVQTTLTLTTTVTTVASSSASRCNSSTAAQPLKLPASPPRPCVLQLHHSCPNHSTSQQPAQCSQPQHIPSGPHVRPFQLQQSQPQLADGTKAAQPARQPGPQS